VGSDGPKESLLDGGPGSIMGRGNFEAAAHCEVGVPVYSDALPSAAGLLVCSSTQKCSFK